MDQSEAETGVLACMRDGADTSCMVLQKEGLRPTFCLSVQRRSWGPEVRWRSFVSVSCYVIQ